MPGCSEVTENDRYRLLRHDFMDRGSVHRDSALHLGYLLDICRQFPIHSIGNAFRFTPVQNVLSCVRFSN